jgi:hypothetical protein
MDTAESDRLTTHAICRSSFDCKLLHHNKHYHIFNRQGKAAFDQLVQINAIGRAACVAHVATFRRMILSDDPYKRRAAIRVHPPERRDRPRTILMFMVGMHAAISGLRVVRGT